MDRDNTLKHILRAARMAQAGSFGVLSTGEKLAAALVLNRADWLADMHYTIAEALDRLDTNWVLLIADASKRLQAEQ